jgi:hypothetical protein
MTNQEAAAIHLSVGNWANAGALTFLAGLAADVNPNPLDTPEGKAWADGWNAMAQRAAERG